MKVTTAVESDAERTIAFLHEFRGEGLRTVLQHDGVPTLEEQKAFIRAHDSVAGIMLLCSERGRVVGSLTADTRHHPQLCHTCEFGMGVLSGERGKGIGTMLLSRLEVWAARAGIRRLELGVFAQNAGAIRLYQRLGFKIEGIRVGALKNGDAYEDIIEMAKIVEPAAIGANKRSLL